MDLLQMTHVWNKKNKKQNKHNKYIMNEHINGFENYGLIIILDDYNKL